MSLLQPVVASSDMVELRLPCKAEWVAVARLAIAGIANRLAYTVEDVEDLKLAVAEACTNRIRHADGAETIVIAAQVSADELCITVRDEGSNVQIAAVPSVAELREDRLGIVLIQSLMDSADYHVDSDGGVVLVMRKSVPAARDS
jgi:serine/threonine-protein kinase RsbW